jgi:hypothetical protein
MTTWLEIAERFSHSFSGANSPPGMAGWTLHRPVLWPGIGVGIRDGVRQDPSSSGTFASQTSFSAASLHQSLQYSFSWIGHQNIMQTRLYAHEMAMIVYHRRLVIR